MLLKRNLFHAPAFLAYQLFQPGEQFGAETCGVVGKIYQVAFAILENLETEFVTAMIGDQCAIERFDAALVAFLVTR